jgi:hypothetical protein
MFGKNRSMIDDPKYGFRASLVYQLTKNTRYDQTLPENLFTIFLGNDKGESKFTLGGYPK